MMSLVLYYKQDRITVVYWREEIRGDDATGAFATQQRLKDKNNNNNNLQSTSMMYTSSNNITYEVYDKQQSN